DPDRAGRALFRHRTTSFKPGSAHSTDAHLSAPQVCAGRSKRPRSLPSRVTERRAEGTGAAVKRRAERERARPQEPALPELRAGDRRARRGELDPRLTGGETHCGAGRVDESRRLRTIGSHPPAVDPVAAAEDDGVARADEL